MAKLLMAALMVVSVMACGNAATEFDDTRGAPGEWGFRPEEGREMRVNPPGFCWRPQEGAVSYALQVARDEGFADVVYEADVAGLNVHCPPQTLPTGELWWRVAAIDAEGGRSEWSRARGLTMPEGVNEFALPVREELLARVPAGHPRLFVRPEDVPNLRELAAGGMADRYAGLVAECEKIMANPPPTEEPPKYPEGTVRGSDEWRKIWWGNRTYATKVLNGAATLAFTRLLGGPEEYGQKARELLMAAAEWDPKGATGYRYNDEAGMPYNYYFSRTYTFVNDLLTEEEREKCREVMAVRGDEMYRHLYPRHLWRPYASHSNRAWHFLGEIGIAFLGEVPGAEDWVWFAANVFANAYPVWADDDGGWHEGAAYWSSYLSRVTWWLDVQRTALGVDGYQKPFFSQAGYFPIYLMPPNCPSGGFGDHAGGRKSTSNVGLVSIFASQAQNAHWQAYVEQLGGPSVGGGYVGFVRGALPDVEAGRLDELPDSRVFEGTGLALLHTDLTDSNNDVQIELKSSPFGSQSHGYESQNSFLLYAYGEPLLIRTGRRDSYGSKHHKQWMWTTRSVNNITVNGISQNAHNSSPMGRIARFETSEEYDYVMGETAGAYPDGLVSKFNRHILFVKPDLVLVLDELATPEPATFEYWLHAPTEMTVNGPEDIRVAVGEAGCDISMLAPAGLTVSQTDQFDPPPRPRVKLTQYHLTAATSEATDATEFVTLIWPYRKGEAKTGAARAERVEAGYAISAEVGDEEIVVLWRTGEGELAGMGLSTDGEMAAVRLGADGEALSWFLHGGERLERLTEDGATPLE